MMKKIRELLQAIPALLSSNVSIFIYIFLFFYLVIWALFAKLIPALQNMAPSSDSQLILGNYTNVLSALGASIAAGAGVQVHKTVKHLHTKHDELQKDLQKLHHKMDSIHEAIKKHEKNNEDTKSES